MAESWQKLHDAFMARMTDEGRARYLRRVQIGEERLARGVLAYPATLTPDTNGTLMVSFIDVPGAISFGDTEADALAHGRDALLTILDALASQRKALPLPSYIEGAPVVELLIDRYSREQWDEKGEAGA